MPQVSLVMASPRWIGHGAVVAAAREAKCRPTVVVRLLLRQLEEEQFEGYRPYLVSVNWPELTSGRPGAVQVCVRSSVECGRLT